MAVVKTVSNYLFQNSVGPVNERAAPQSQLIPVTATISPRPALLQDTALKDAG
jgi:hypothetical protein